MADKVCPPVKSAGVADGIPMPSSYSTLTTPNPVYGRNFGEGTPASEAVDSSKIMGKK